MPPEPGGPSCRHCGRWITECQPDCAHEGWYHHLTRNHYCGDGEHEAEPASAPEPAAPSPTTTGD